MPARFQFRRDTAANWTAANPVLAAGEVGYETDTGRMKVGTGTTSWSNLFYFVPTAGTSSFQEWTANGSTTVGAVSAGKTLIKELFMVGGGGGGGNGGARTSAANGTGFGGSGGGGGCIVYATDIPVTDATTLSYTIGAGGTAGQNGGNTIFSIGNLTFTATGGPKGNTGGVGTTTAAAAATSGSATSAPNLGSLNVIIPRLLTLQDGVASVAATTLTVAPNGAAGQTAFGSDSPASGSAGGTATGTQVGTVGAAGDAGYAGSGGGGGPAANGTGSANTAYNGGKGGSGAGGGGAGGRSTTTPAGGNGGAAGANTGGGGGGGGGAAGGAAPVAGIGGNGGSGYIAVLWS